MTEYNFTLIAQHRPEVLERLLRVIRHRGFTVVAMVMHLTDNQVHVVFTVKSERALSLLLNQLTKLPDVLEVV